MMNIKILIVSLLILTVYNFSLNNNFYDQIKGVWSTGDQTSGCRIDVQFHYKNYIAYTTGSNNCQNGVFLGIYSLTPKQIFVQYSYSPPYFTEKFLKLDWEIKNGILNLTSKQSGTLLYSRITNTGYQQLNGLWNTHTEGATGGRIEVQDGLYLNYNIPNNITLVGVTPYFGLLELKPNNIVKVSYAHTYKDSPPVQTVFNNVHYNYNNGQPKLQNVDNVPFNITLLNKMPTTIFEGLWAGKSVGLPDCQTTVEFTSQLYRQYQICGGSNPTHTNANLGTFNIENSTHITLGFSFSNQGLNQTALTLSYTLNGDRLDVIETKSQVLTKLKKVPQPPNAVYCQIVLDTDFSGFKDSDQTKVYDDIISKTGMSKSNFFITEKNQGSVLLNGVFVDDQTPEGVTAVTQFTKIQFEKTLGGFNVKKIVDLNNSTATTNASVKVSFKGFGVIITFIMYLLLFNF